MAALGCEAVAFGTVPWSRQQRTRIDRFAVEGVASPGLIAYEAARLRFKSRPMAGASNAVGSPGPGWWVVSELPNLVAANAIAGRPWWIGFTDLWQEIRSAVPAGQRKWVFFEERGGLAEMTQDPRLLPEGPQAQLVRACHEAWRRRLGALGNRARSQGLDFGRLAEAERERVRVSLARCKSAAMLRQTLTDFWSRAGGPLPDLQEGWVTVLPLLDRSWKEARDLALLALASYPGAGEPPSTENRGETVAEGRTA
jgi:CRISPR-associated protein Cas8a1/Csx13